jgi:hypothetical protein
MCRSSHYHAEADHARRLAETTIQLNVAQELRRVAEEFDRLADNLASGEYVSARARPRTAQSAAPRATGFTE